MTRVYGNPFSLGPSIVWAVPKSSIAHRCSMDLKAKRELAHAIWLAADIREKSWQTTNEGYRHGSFDEMNGHVRLTGRYKINFSEAAHMACEDTTLSPIIMLLLAVAWSDSLQWASNIISCEYCKPTPLIVPLDQKGLFLILKGLSLTVRDESAVVIKYDEDTFDDL